MSIKSSISKLSYGFKFKILSAFFLVAVLSLIFLVVSYWSFDRLGKMDTLKGHVVNVNFLLFHAINSEKDLITQHAILGNPLDTSDNKIIRRYNKAISYALEQVDSAIQSQYFQALPSANQSVKLRKLITDHQSIYARLVSRVQELEEAKEDSFRMAAVPALEKKIGINAESGLVRELQLKFKEIEPIVRQITVEIETEYNRMRDQSISILIGVFLFEIIIGFYFSMSFGNSVVRTILNVRNSLGKLAVGEIPEKLESDTGDELSEAIYAINGVVENLEKSASFAEFIGEGKFEEHFEVAGDTDKLGNALINMRDRLQSVAEEDKKRNWAIEGLAQFADLLRKYDSDTAELSKALVRKLVSYMGANQGAVYISEKPEGAEDVVLVQKGLYAWNKEKLAQKVIPKGVGIVGQCFAEKDKILMTEIPNSYVSITSGLGKSNPSCILCIPLLVGDECYGVFELASFQVFMDHQVDFLMELSESIASTIASVKTAEQTKTLLEDAKEMTEQMRSTEEEMRQNAEELEATMEENEEQNRRLQDEIDRLRSELEAKG